MATDFSKIRREYTNVPLNEEDMQADPIKQFNNWFQQAVQTGIDLPNAMALATASKDGKPTVRYVLLKAFNEEGFVFYSHSVSVKGQQLAENSRASLVLYWSPMDRQIRIEGDVSVLSDAEADDYFNSRPYESRISVWVAPQSSIVESREFMERRMDELRRQFHDNKVPRPEDWVGYRVYPQTLEFWQGRENRLHDRFLYKRRENNTWSLQRLAP